MKADRTRSASPQICEITSMPPDEMAISNDLEIAPQDDPGRIADRIETMYGKHRGGTLETDYDLAPVTEYRRDVLTKRLAEYLDTLSAGRDTSIVSMRVPERLSGRYISRTI